MRDFIYIGSAPSEEECAQVGAEDYGRRSQLELSQFKRMLETSFPLVNFRIKRQSHDFGYYSEVVAYYDDEDEAQTEQAYDAECHFERWDDEARKVLKDAGYL